MAETCALFQGGGPTNGDEGRGSGNIRI
eukprot:Gb_25972 [translate_table: standard]